MNGEDHDAGDQRQQPDALRRLVGVDSGAMPERSCRGDRGAYPQRREHEAQSEPDETEVGERLDDVSMRIGGGRRSVRVAQKHRCIASGAVADDRAPLIRLPRDVPIERALAAERGQAVCAVPHVRVRVRERAPVVRDRAGETARARCQGDRSGDGNEREGDDERDPDAIARPRRRWAADRREAQHETGHGAEHERDREYRSQVVSRGAPRGKRGVVGGECGLGKGPGDYHEGAECTDPKHRCRTQTQRRDGEPEGQPKSERDEGTA